jgi:hypothetical protein
MQQIETQHNRDRSQIEFCIDAFAEETGYVPADAHSVRVPGELSPPLERLVGSLAPGTGWRAWSEGARAWFVQGTLADSSDCRLDQPTVCLTFRDHDAAPLISGVWRRNSPAHWDLLQYFGDGQVC